MVFSLVYVSAVTVPLTADGRAVLLRQSRRANTLTQVTGLLLCRHDTFLQFLEGPRPVVDDLYAKINADPRHHDLVTVRTRTQPARQFPDWTMAVGDIADASDQPPHHPGRRTTVPFAVFHTETTVPTLTTTTEADFLHELLDLFDP